MSGSGVNFINVLRMNFSYERCFSSYVLALSKKSYEFFVRKTLIKLTAGLQNDLNVNSKTENSMST